MDGSTAGPTDIHRGCGAAHFFASFIAAARKLLVVTGPMTALAASQALSSVTRYNMVPMTRDLWRVFDVLRKRAPRNAVIFIISIITTSLNVCSQCCCSTAAADAFHKTSENLVLSAAYTHGSLFS